MKKIYILLSVLAALAFSVVPSQALIGMPDDVPGMNMLQGFFVVEVGTTGIDTLMVFQEVGGQGGAAAAAQLNLHWRIFTRSSVHLKDRRVPYTPYDVTSLSVRDLITNVLNDADRAALQTTLGGRDVYIGYITVANVTQANVPVNYNNMLGKTYLIDLDRGKACADNMVAYEYMPDVAVGAPTRAFPGYGWLAAQYQAATAGTPADGEFMALANPFGAPNVEALNADALAASEQREAASAFVAVAVAPTQFYLMPRFYLANDTAENYIFLWKSRNHVGAGVNATVEVTLYDTAENGTSAYITIPDELNIIDIVEWLPNDFKVTYPSAGWIDIQLTAASGLTNWNTMDWVGYNWQLASNASAGLNWSALNNVPRMVFWPGK